ncbi:sensor histidine kinase [Altibacter sp. HG106]|uniref:sensor histidine kinase n=1 Tax=Altibacter sp. HG106 TaxID=3023937 RepID=UPI002350ED4C|nr:sensor histidine kinase [Altibacter sp. HG106]MDC7993890.1 histidine kinase [Altibacter sp. HG106]
MHRRILLIGLLLPWLLWGQREYQYATSNGLPSNTVYDIVQDSAGFIWIATSKGVVTYDGTSFKTFTVQDGLPNNDTWKLEVTPDGRVWYVSKSNRQGFIANDSIYSFPLADNSVISPKCFGVTNHGVSLYGGGTFVLKQNSWKKTLPLTTDDGVNAAIHLNDSIVINKTQSHFEIYLHKNQQLTKIKSIQTNTNFDSLNIRSASYGIYHNLIWQMLDYGLLLVNLERDAYRIIPMKKNKKKGIQYVWANDATIQWKVGDQLQIFSHGLQTLETITHDDLRDYSRAIKDDQGNLWMTSLYKGIKMIPAISLHTNQYFEGKKVQALSLSEDTLLIGVRNEPLHSNVRGALTPTNLIAEGNIYHIKTNSGHGTYVLGATQSAAEKNTIFRSEVYEDERKRFGTKHDHPAGFIDLYEGETFHYVLTHDFVVTKKADDPYFKTLQNFSGGVSMIQYQDQLILLASDGLHRIDKDTILPFHEQNRNRPIPYLSATLHENKLLLGTDGFGVHVLQGDRIFPIPSTHGLSVNRTIYKDGHLWLATQKGIQVLKLQPTLEASEIVDSYYQSDGLLDRNVNDIAIRDSTLFAATDLGLSEINLNDTRYRTKPTLYFETDLDSMVLPYRDAQSLSIAFNTLEYTNQNNLVYYYRLSPEQEEWQTAQNREVTFVSLAPGAYQLEVRVIDQHHNFSTRRLPLTIVPLWWQTKWFRYLLIGASLLILMGIGFLFYRQIKRREQIKSERHQKISRLELQALRSQMNPHFVHNSLHAIQFFVQRNEVALSEKYLSQFSRLIRQFFEYSRVQSVTLSEEIELLRNYLTIEKMRFEEKLAYTITIDPSLATDRIKIPSMLLQPLVENAINHGIFHKETQGTVTLHFIKEQENILKIIVEDDGIGILEARKLNEKLRKDGTSNSTQVLNERMALLKQEDRWNITFLVEDLNQYKGKTGTRITLTIAIKYEDNSLSGRR